MPCKTGRIALALVGFAALAVGAPPADLALLVAVTGVPQPITVHHAGDGSTQ